MTCPIEPIPRSLMAAFVAAHHYAVRVRHWPQRGCAAGLLTRRAHRVPARLRGGSGEPPRKTQP